jgi:hypothetical protein
MIGRVHLYASNGHGLVEHHRQRRMGSSAFLHVLYSLNVLLKEGGSDSLFLAMRLSLNDIQSVLTRSGKRIDTATCDKEEDRRNIVLLEHQIFDFSLQLKTLTLTLL